MHGIWLIRANESDYLNPACEIVSSRKMLPPMTLTLSIDLMVEARRKYPNDTFKVEKHEVHDAQA